MCLCIGGIVHSRSEFCVPCILVGERNIECGRLSLGKCAPGRSNSEKEVI